MILYICRPQEAHDHAYIGPRAAESLSIHDSLQIYIQLQVPIECTCPSGPNLVPGFVSLVTCQSHTQSQRIRFAYQDHPAHHVHGTAEGAPEEGVVWKQDHLAPRCLPKSLVSDPQLFCHVVSSFFASIPTVTPAI